MPKVKSLALASLAALSLAPAARADYLTGSLGWYDMNKKVDQAALFGLEYRFNDWMYGIHPIAGAWITNDGSAYGYGGINWNVPLITNQLYLVPSFAAGAYTKGSSHKDLGGALEFRSGIELDYQLPNTHQVGIAFNHISNASIYNHNPGVETLLVNYSIPVSLFGR